MSENIVTVKDLIKVLLDTPLHHEILVRDSKGKRVKGASICAKENPKVMEVLLG